MSKIKLFCLLMFVVLLACEITPGRGFIPDPPGNGPDDIPVVNNLFVSSDVPGQILFETNDPRNWSGEEASLLFLLKEKKPSFSTREVELSKLSGDNTAGYGLVYNYRNDPVYGDTMLIVQINTLKEYMVMEFYDNKPEIIIPWTESPLLNGGYNSRNSLRLDYADGGYSLFINNQFAVIFQDDEAPQHTGGRQGYVVVISPRDDFPETAVKILFTEITE